MEPDQVTLCSIVIGLSGLAGLGVLIWIAPRSNRHSRWNWVALGVALMGVSVAFTLGVLRLANVAVVSMLGFFAAMCIASAGSRSSCLASNRADERTEVP